MKKLFIIILLVSISTAFSNLNNVKLDIGIETGFPFGDFGDVANTGVGISFKGHYPLEKALNLTFRTGFNYFPGENLRYSYGTYYYKIEYDFYMIPLMFGADYYFVRHNPNLYAGFECGFTLITTSWDSNYSNSTHDSDDSDTDLEFGIAPNIGYLFRVGKHIFDANLALRFIDFGDNAHLALKIAYRLPA